MKQIGGGFFTDVYQITIGDKDTVLKIPKATAALVQQDKKNIQRALDAHRDYLSTYLVPTRIIDYSPSPYGYALEQEYIPNMIPASLQTSGTISDELVCLLSAGLEMQTKERILFDAFGFEGYGRILESLRDVLAYRSEELEICFANIASLGGHAGHESYKFFDIGYIPIRSLNPQGRIGAQIINPLLYRIHPQLPQLLSREPI